jgi:hypothetical protein
MAFRMTRPVADPRVVGRSGPRNERPEMNMEGSFWDVASRLSNPGPIA